MLKVKLLTIAMLMGLMPLAMAADSDKSGSALKGAVVGAGTNVLASTALDVVAPSQTYQTQYMQVQGPDGQMYMQAVNVPVQESQTQKVIKQGIAGAITGAVAAKVAGSDSKDQKSDSGSGILDNVSEALTTTKIQTEDDDDHDHDKHHGHRPPGWDRGRKEGWGGGDEPPGWSKKDKKGKHKD
jgi:hypothetical protein